MPQYVDVKGVSDSGKRFIEYTLAAGFDFFVFVEEPLYASYLNLCSEGCDGKISLYRDDHRGRTWH